MLNIYASTRKDLELTKEYLCNLLDLHISNIEEPNLKEILTMLHEVKAKEAIPYHGQTNGGLE